MASLLWILLQFVFMKIINGGVFEFVPGTNLVTSKGWSSTSCSKDRILLENEEALSVYFDSNLGINEMIFSDTAMTEVILGDSAVIYGKTKEAFPESGCGVYFKYSDDTPLPLWHDPTVWKYLNTSTDPQAPLLHCEMIPGQYDIAYFNPMTSHQVFIDMPVRVGALISGGYSHTTETMWAHVETVEGSLQFQLTDDLDPFDFFDVVMTEGSTSIHIMEKECEDRTGCVSYTLNSKIQAEICNRVKDCPTESSIPCSNAFRPRGHCCLICGGLIKFETTTNFDHQNTRTVINSTLRRDAPEGRFSLIKLADWQYQLVLIRENGDSDFDANWIKEKTEQLKQVLMERVDGVIDETVTITYSLKRSSYKKVILSLGLFCLISLLISIAIIGIRKKATILNWFVGTRVHLRALWRDEGDRIQLEMSDAQRRHSLAQESMSSFENPSFKTLMTREEEKATAAAVYEKKVPSGSYDDKSGITFTNPLFQGGANA